MNSSKHLVSAKHCPTTICSLVCHRHVEMDIACLGSIARLCEEPISLRIHDDGSLTEEDCGRLSDIGQVEFVSRRQADELMESVLKNLPDCLAFRKELPLALKLLPRQQNLWVRFGSGRLPI